MSRRFENQLSASDRIMKTDPYAALLNAAFFEPDRVCPLLVNCNVQPEWFPSKELKEICAAVLQLYSEGVAVDPVTVADRVKSNGAEFDAMTFVEMIVSNNLSMPSHAVSYIDIIKGEFFTMTMLRGMDLIGGKLSNGDITVTDAAEKIQRMAIDLIEMKNSGNEKAPWQMRAEARDRWWDLAQKGPGSIGGIPWGIRGLDNLTTGIYAGINVVAARPSVGKTLFEGFLRRHFLSRGLKVFCVSRDMDPEQVAARDTCAIAGLSLNKARSGFMTPSDKSKADAVVEMTKSWHGREWISGDYTTSEAIVAKARAIQIQYGLDVITVDYAQLLDTVDSRGMNDNSKISKAVAILKTFSLQTKIPIILLSQLSRATEKENREPQLSDLRDSGSIEQDATTVTFLYADPKVADYWTKLHGKQHWKNLEIRPIVANCMKNQNGSTGVVCLRELTPYFTVEEAIPCKGGPQPGDDPDNFNYGYDYSKPLSNPYIIARHPLGAYEMFNVRWFEEMNEAAKRIGNQPWERLEQYDANGFEDGMYQLACAKTAKATNNPPEPSELVQPTLSSNPADDLPF